MTFHLDYSLQTLFSSRTNHSPIPLHSYDVPLQEIVTSEAVINSGILNDPAVRASLIPHLPESQQTDAFLEETIRSPQFRQVSS